MNKFEFSTRQATEEQKSVYEYSSVFKEAFGSFKKNKTAMAGVVIFIILLILSVIFTLLPNYDAMGIGNPYEDWSADHWFGTDASGRDFWSRCWGAVEYSLILALITTTLNVLIAITIGLFMGYFDTFDKYFGHVIKIMYALPTIIVLILFSVAFSPDSSEVAFYGLKSFGVVVLSLVFSGWVNASQQIRGVVLKTRNLDFITASQTLGTKRFQILRTFFSYALPIIIVQFVIIFPRMIISEATLGFLGLSVPNIPTLGNLINDGRPVFLNYPRLLLVPLAYLAVTTVSIQLIGFGVEDALLAKGGR